MKYRSDLTSTYNVTYVSRDSFGGAVAWRTSGGGTIAGGLTHGQTFDQWDAFSRYDRIRYDSPALGPVILSVSAGQADLYEGAARWSQDLGDGQISAGVFYGKQNNLAKHRFGGSAAYLFSFGTSLLVSYGENEDDPAAGVSSLRSKNWYLKVGHNWGNNSVSASYGESKDVVDGFNNKGFQLGFNHNLPKVKVDLYAGIQQNTLDVPSGTSAVDDIWTVAAGTKLKFN